MRILLAGATGALGRRLTPMMVAFGHTVAGTTRSPAKAEEIAAAGATPVVMDGLDAEAVRRAVDEAKPDVVVHQLTALTGSSDLKKFDETFAETNVLRTTGLDHLLAAAREAGVDRFVAQSYTGWPNPRSGGVKTEDDPLDPDPPAGARQTLAAIRYLEDAVTHTEGIAGLVLRYGAFYGPGTGFAPDGEIIQLVRRRRMPVVGGGRGVWSFIHIDDAARATLAALDHGAPGLYNVVDDEPAPVAEWLPYLASAIGARPPLRVPAWVARPMIGAQGIAMMTGSRGSSNAKARRELGWEPQWPTWRRGFRDGLG
jgi:2-alkyl-3-oxoalkanoate reductase